VRPDQRRKIGHEEFLRFEMVGADAEGVLKGLEIVDDS
jgi:hypothetical protein